MGWMTWQHYRCVDTTEAVVRQAIEEISGHHHGDFRSFGYEYIFVDDCWMRADRDSQGDWVRSEQFGSEIASLVAAAKAKNLKLGLYTSVGEKTCEGRAASQHFFAKDAAKLRDWGIRGLKVDGCGFKSESERDCEFFNAYLDFGRELHNKNENFYLSCSWPAYIDPGHGLDDGGAALQRLAQVCHSWRNFGDIGPSEETLDAIVNYWAANSAVVPFGPARVQETDDERGFTVRAPLIDAAGPGHWNDADQLLVGEPGIAIETQRRQMSIWAVIASPLFLSTDIGRMSHESREIALNADVIAVNQDVLGIQGHVAFVNERLRVWVRRIEHREPRLFAIVFENLTKHPEPVSGKIPGIPALVDPTGNFWTSEAGFRFKNLWTTASGCIGSQIGCQREFVGTIAPKSVIMLRVEKINVD